MANKKTEYSIQYLENLSADLSVSPPVLRRGLVGKDDSGNYYNVAVNPMGDIGSNATITLSQSDNVVASTQTLTKTIGGVSYERTLSYNSAGEFLSASAWSKV